MSGSEVAQVSAIVAVVSAILALAGVCYTSLQFRLARTIAAADFLLRLEGELREHQGVHLRLRPGGEWANGDGPKSPEEWAAVEAYMGLFERVGSTLVDSRIIDRGLATRSYAYRISNIVENPLIRTAKLEQERDSWTDFIRLQNTLLGE